MFPQATGCSLPVRTARRRKSKMDGALGNVPKTNGKTISVSLPDNEALVVIASRSHAKRRHGGLYLPLQDCRKAGGRFVVEVLPRGCGRGGFLSSAWQDHGVGHCCRPRGPVGSKAGMLSGWMTVPASGMANQDTSIPISLHFSARSFAQVSPVRATAEILVTPRRERQSGTEPRRAFPANDLHGVSCRCRRPATSEKP